MAARVPSVSPLSSEAAFHLVTFQTPQILHGKMQFVDINIRDKNGNYPLRQIGFIQQSQDEMALYDSTALSPE